MNFGKSAVFCFGIAAALWAFTGAVAAETMNTLAAPQAGSSVDLSTWFGWDATIEDFLSERNTIYDFAGRPEINPATFDAGWVSIVWSDWDRLDKLLFAKEVAGWTSEAVPEPVSSNAVPSRVPEPELWVLVVCGLTFVGASAALRRRSRTGK